MHSQLVLRFLEVLKAIAPVIVVACLFQAVLVQAPAALFVQFLAGSLLAMAGMVLLFAGIDLGLVPMGRYIGAELPRKGSVSALLAASFALGVTTTVAEPDVLVLAEQVETASNSALEAPALVYLLAAGVGAFSALAILRILRGFSMVYLLAIVYAAMILLSFLSPAHFVPLAYDAGSVTTGVLSSPVLLALTVGLTSVLPGRSEVSDSFGLLGLASAGPVIVMLLLGILPQ